MKKVFIAIALSFGLANAMWQLVSCNYGEYNMGGQTYYGNVGIYENDGQYYTMFFGGNYCSPFLNGN